MRKTLIMLGCLALAGCGPRSESSEPYSDNGATSDEAATPGGIGVTAAPGVAFNYHYAFSLAPERIATVQETHAQACEKLGLARCRITGMHYQLVGENDVDASLQFKLDPAIARAFGKNGGAIVQQADGTLVSADITGTDAAAAITAANADRARAEDEQKRLDTQLDRKGLGATERTELQQQRADTAQRIAAASSASAGQQASLATTPMEFDYRSGKAIRGFDASAPFKSALDTAIGSAQVTLAALLGAIALFGPPLIVLLLLWLAVRRFGPRLYRLLGFRQAQTLQTPPGD